MGREERLEEFYRRYGTSQSSADAFYAGANYYLAGKIFYQVARLGISKYDVSSHDDRYANFSTQHDKSHEWGASAGLDATVASASAGVGQKTAKSSGKKKEATHKSAGRIKGQHGGNPGADP